MMPGLIKTDTGDGQDTTRVGAAIDMATKKYSTVQIMQEGTWKKAETVMRYIRHVDAHAGAMVDFMDAHVVS